MTKKHSKYSSGVYAFKFEDFEIDYKGKTYATSGDWYIEFEGHWVDPEWEVDWVPENVENLIVYSNDGDHEDLAMDKTFRSDLKRALIAKYDDDIYIELIQEIESNE